MAVNSTGSSTTATNIYNSLGIKNNGIGGLASGLDTDSIVMAMTAATRAKIAKQGQQKQLLSWKMAAYRSTGSALKTFQDKYLKVSSTSTAATNISSFSFFNTYKTSSSSSKVTVKTSSTGATGSFQIDKILKLAESETIRTQQPLTKTLAGTEALVFNPKFGEDFTGKTITVDMRLWTRTISLDDLNNSTNQADLDARLQTLVNDAFGVSGITVSRDDVTQEVVLKYGASIGTIHDPNFAADFAGKTLLMTVGGTTKTIKLDTLTSATSPEEVRSKLQDLVTNAFGTKTASDGSGQVPLVKVGLKDSRITFDSETSQITMGTNANDVLGFGSGMTNRVTTGTKLVDMADSLGGLAGNTYKFSINGKEITIGENETLNDLINKINNSSAGVRVTYSLYSGEMILTANSGGGTNNIDMEDIQGNLASKLFGSKGGNALNSGNIAVSSSATAQNASYFEGMSTDQLKSNSVYLEYLEFNLTVNGITKNVKLSTASLTVEELRALKNGDYDMDQIATLMNDGIKATFGSDVGVSFLYDDTAKKFVLKGTNSATFKMEKSVNNSKHDALAMLGFNEGTNNHTIDIGDTTPTLLSDLLAGGFGTTSGTLTITKSDGSGTVDIEYGTGSSPSVTTVRDLIIAINAGVGMKAAKLDENGMLVIGGYDGFSISDSTADGLMSKLFGVTAPYTAAAESYVVDDGTNNGNRKYGQNAEIVVDGKVISSSSNTITFDGITVEVTGVTVDENGNALPGEDKPIQINVSADADALVERVKEWINEYNTMVIAINTSFYEDKNTDYAPLTDEQKAEMTTDEIEKWELEAKKGVLRSDSTLRTILSELRQSLMNKVGAAGISLYDIGISTTSNANGGSDPLKAGTIELMVRESDGHLIGEERLRKMFESNPEKVRTLFTDTSDGIAARLNKAIDRAAKTSSVDRGSLVRIAGTEFLTGDNSSILGKQIDRIDDYVTRLKERLEAEYNRYWKQFSALETALQNMNAQSSWLASFGSTGG